MIAKLSCLTVVSLLAGVAFSESFRIVPTPDEAKLKMSLSFARFSKALGTDGGAYSNGWKHVFRQSNAKLKPEVGAFVAEPGVLTATAEYTEWIYHCWAWAGKEGATVTLSVPEGKWLPEIPYLVDLVAMTARPIEAADMSLTDGKLTIRNLPVKATPLAVVPRNVLNLDTTDVRDWKLSVRVGPDDKLLFAVGEKPELVVQVTDKDGKDVSEPGAKAIIRWYRSHDPYTNEVVALDGRPIRRPMDLGKPGAVTCEVSLKIVGFRRDIPPKRAVPVKPKQDDMGHLGADGKHNAVQVRHEDFGCVVGCVFDWQKIRPGKPAPADIDEVWDKMLAEDAKLPIEVKKCELIRTTKTGVKVYRVVLNSTGGDVHAEMSIPKGAEEGKKYPIWCLFQAYGCASMWTWAWEWAITIAPNTHSIENGREGKYYKDLIAKGGPLFNYGFDTNTNAKLETTYFKNILLRDVRAVRYLMSRPEWDGKQITYYGSSQGGYQSTALLGLIPETTELNLICPWAIEYGGSPCHWRPKWGEGVQYCDPMNLVHRAKGKGQKVTVRFGIADTACPVDGIFAWINALPKDIDLTALLYQNKGHNVSDGEKHYAVEIRRKPGEEAQIIPHFDWPRVYEN